MVLMGTRGKAQQGLHGVCTTVELVSRKPTSLDRSVDRGLGEPRGSGCGGGRVHGAKLRSAEGLARHNPAAGVKKSLSSHDPPEGVRALGLSSRAALGVLASRLRDCCKFWATAW
jgi:hypothetical protein